MESFLSHLEDLTPIKKNSIDSYSRLQCAMKIGNFWWWELKFPNWVFECDKSLIDLLDMPTNPNLSKNAQLSFDNYMNCIYPDDREFIKLAVDRCMKRESDKFQTDYRIITNGDKLRWYSIRGKVVEFDNQGSLTKIKGVIEDITERKESEQLLSDTLVKKNSENQAKSEFLAAMSHELRTPLNSVIGFSHILCDEKFGSLNEQQLKYVQNISGSGKHLLSLVNELLDISKIKAGKLKLDLQPVNINEILSEANQMIYPLANEKKLNININFDNSLPFAYADKKKLRQILYNLLSNAVKFTEARGHIIIDSTINNGFLEISVSDDGIGIPKEKQSQIFDPFIQVDEYGARKLGGTGLGLSLVKNLIDLHGGNIWLESTIKKGSTFTFTIPINVEN